MGTRKYDKLSIEDFGAHLLDNLDLDPIYVALSRLKCVEGGWDLGRLNRWLIAYWCFYHAGAACYIASRPREEFWDWMERAAANRVEEPCPLGGNAVNGGWPRGHERRHFRGAQGYTAVKELKAKYPEPEDFVVALQSVDAGTSVPFSKLSEKIREHRSFGPWIAFKVGDMLERVLGKQVDFTEAEVFMFEAPREAAILLWRTKQNLPGGARPKDEAQVIKQVLKYLSEAFSGHRAPPSRDRLLNIQEYETILCKWGSHVRGSYPLWNDIDEINSGLAIWSPVCPAAAEFLDACPKRR
jgi:hypothetical protein